MFLGVRQYVWLVGVCNAKKRELLVKSLRNNNKLGLANDKELQKRIESTSHSFKVQDRRTGAIGTDWKAESDEGKERRAVELPTTTR
ncbi:hypothetical protein BHE74_00026467 [Ensete ventricosum]|nr:hypothetical protein BHE74_00026467 [Ensete ventricosum]